MALPQPPTKTPDSDGTVWSGDNAKSLVAAERGTDDARRLEVDSSRNLYVNVAGSTGSGLATAANQVTEISNLQALNSLVPSVYDYISLSYTGSDLTQVVYRNGGPTGTIVSTLTLDYSGGNLASVTKS